MSKAFAYGLDVARHRGRFLGTGEVYALDSYAGNLVKQTPQTASARSVSLLQVGRVFLRIGLSSFGGLGATLAVIQRELIEKRELLTTRQLTEALTFTKPLPGATAFQVVSYLGFQLGGWRGSAIAATAFILPPMVGMVAMARLYDLVNDLPRFPSVLAGLVAAVVGLLLATTFKMGKANVIGATTLLIAAAACLVAVRFRVNGALIVGVAGLIGFVVLMPRDASKPTPRS